jgi:uncharacterized protein YjiS (DUF1127 family)
MTATVGKSQFSFELPKLSYVDASLEEPGRDRLPSSRSRRGGLGDRGLGAHLAQMIAAVATWHRKRVAFGELALMSDRELSDIGLTRSDLPRVFDPEHNQDLVRRSVAG